MAREIVFLALFVFAILSLLSLFQMCGVFGKGLSALLFGLLGALAYVFPVYLVVTAGLYLANAKNQRLRHKVWYSAGIYWSVCGLFQWVVNDPVQNVWEVYTVCAENHGGGGFFGGILSFELARVLGRAWNRISSSASSVPFRSFSRNSSSFSRMAARSLSVAWWIA